jgi:hypothetical protein
MDNVLAKNENANTAHWKHARSNTRPGLQMAAEGRVHSDYGTCAK